jgi:hypothetical protein
MRGVDWGSGGMRSMTSWNSGLVSLLCCSGTRLPVWWKAWMNSCSYGISIVWLLMDLSSGKSVRVTQPIPAPMDPFSGRFIISSHIYKGEFPLPPSGI